jgi:lipopolysaccharide transport system ATP-binding protein
LAAEIRNDRDAPASEVEIDQAFSVRMEYRIVSEPDREFFPNFHFYRQDGTCAFCINATNVKRLSPGEHSAECHVPANFMNDGLYSVGFALTSYESGVSVHFSEMGAITFNIHDRIDGVVTRAGYSGPMPGAVRPVLPWTLKRID